MKEHFDIKKAFDDSLGQTDTKPKPLSSWQETNGQQKAKITFFGQRNLVWKKEANRKNKTEKRGFPSRHSPFLYHLRRPRKSISAKRKIAFSRTIFRLAQNKMRGFWRWCFFETMKEQSMQATCEVCERCEKKVWTLTVSGDRSLSLKKRATRIYISHIYTVDNKV